MNLASNHITLLVILGMTAIASSWAFWRRGMDNFNKFDKDATIPLRAILMIFVIFSHLPILKCLHLGTPAVSVFFFVAGYGMMCAITNRGDKYLRHFELNCLVKLFVPFAICSFVWIVWQAIAKSMGLGHTNFGVAGLISGLRHGYFTMLLPNSWYPFAYFALSVVFATACRAFIDKHRIVAIVGGVLLMYCALRYVAHWDSLWWRTLWTFVIGAIYFKHEDIVCAVTRRTGSVAPIILFAMYAIASYWSFSKFGKAIIPFVDECHYWLQCMLIVIGLYALRLPRWKWLVKGGGIAYEIYLVHGVIYCVSKDILGEGWATVIMFCLLPWVAYIVHNLSESLGKQIRKLYD